MKQSRALRLTFSLGLLPLGALMVLLAGQGRSGVLWLNLGLAFMVAGVLEGFRIIALLRSETEESGKEVADQVFTKIATTLASSGGLKLVAAVRRGYGGYYAWATSTERQELFFAGRSVLHRIDDDFKTRGLVGADEVLYRKLCEGSSIRILFLDPRSDVLPRLAREEGQPLNSMLFDIGRSLGTCRRLSKLINDKPPSVRGRIDIRVYDEVPYFAYHKVDDHVVVGFYFTTNLGSSSSAFKIDDPHIMNMFGEHFVSIFGRAVDGLVLEVSDRRSGAVFNERLYNSLREYILTTLEDSDLKTDLLNLL